MVVGTKYRVIEGKKVISLVQLIMKYNRLTKDRKLEVLWEALDCMQSFNGRGKWTCVAMCMGYQETEIDIGNEKDETMYQKEY